MQTNFTVKKNSILVLDLSHYNRPTIVKRIGCESQTEQNLNSSLPGSCVTWGKSLNFSEPCHPTGDNSMLRIL